MPYVLLRFYCYLACQAREKFVSVRKGTRADVVTGLEEVNFDNFFIMNIYSACMPPP